MRAAHRFALGYSALKSQNQYPLQAHITLLIRAGKLNEYASFFLITLTGSISSCTVWYTEVTGSQAL